MNLLFKTIEQESYKNFEKHTSYTFKTLEIDFWPKYINWYKRHTEAYQEQFNKMRRDIPDLNSILNNESITLSRKELYLKYKGDMKKRFNNQKYPLMDRFTRKFQNTPSGTKKNWKQIPAEQIDIDFMEAKEYVFKIFEQSKNCEFPGFEDSDQSVQMLTPEEATELKYF